MVRWLAIGSVPSAFAGVFVLRSLGDSQHLQDRIKVILGSVLLLAAAAMTLKMYLAGRQHRREELARSSLRTSEPRSIRVRPIATLATGIVGGLVVGMTSVGSGSLIIISLSLMYPTLLGSELVGTDLVQAVPL